MHQRSYFFALHHFLQIAYGVHVKDNNGQVVLLAHAGSCKVHDFQTAFQHFVVGNVVELLGRRVFFRIGGIDAVNACPFQQT